MRLLVIGGSGLVGSHLLAEALRRGHHAVGTFRERAVPGLEPLDAARLADFEALLDRHRPDRVIHAAGWTWVDGCEDDPARAMEENCHQPVRLAEICQRRGLRFAYISTSYIFDGSAGPYDESAVPAPINAYARSKWEAEQRLVAATDGSVLLPRVICVYGVEARRKNFAYQVGDALRVGKILTLPSDQRGNPTWAGVIARTTLDLLEREERGAFHLGGADPDCDRIAWAEHLVRSFKQVGVEAATGFTIVSKSTAILAQKALRPLHAGMVSRRLDRPCFGPADDAAICREIAGTTP
jgi:dTDP-4-dehydrorhamnose reductase